ncbi:hypothetical protein E2C01_038819 [Portunus trituberculatus]|uniref:Uncharacterized protein n=1 Tax=Portunus trituberculatus TaxID=210409 RepID=A0A5B7FL30_PORTR|nr:hypothetical protein [Portunus trituberculatus]
MVDKWTRLTTQELKGGRKESGGYLVPRQRKDRKESCISPEDREMQALGTRGSCTREKYLGTSILCLDREKKEVWGLGSVSPEKRRGGQCLSWLLSLPMYPLGLRGILYVQQNSSGQDNKQPSMDMGALCQLMQSNTFEEALCPRRVEPDRSTVLLQQGGLILHQHLLGCGNSQE